MKKRMLILCISALAMSLSACGSDDTYYRDKIEELEDQVDDLEQENKELKEQLEQAGVSVTTGDLFADQDNSANSLPSNFVAEASGICGVNLTWEYGNSILYIYGTGDMTDYMDYNAYGLPSHITAPWDDISKEVERIIIAEGVTSIGAMAFYEFSTLGSVELPDTITSMGKKAFWDCPQLASITIPNNVTEFEETLYKCNGLQTVIWNGNTYSLDNEDNVQLLEEAGILFHYGY